MSYPLAYEIQTRCWLWELSQRHNTPITLGNVPEMQFALWRHLGFTHIWLMGVWSTGPRGQQFSREDAGLQAIGSKLLQDFSSNDIIGSPYAVSGYRVAPSLGGEAGLKEFRKQLLGHGLKLILDFIPNHTGLDHPWLKQNPELYVQSHGPTPETFCEKTSHGMRWIAHGKDPYFPAWADTAQLDYRNPQTRLLITEELKTVASLCDGVRCDMAMLVLNDVFARTWGKYPFRPNVENPAKPEEFWTAAISTIKRIHPSFLFLAEAYWDLEPRLLELGFDFAYDKKLTDLILARRSADVQRHLLTSNPDRGAHFLENHDEPRAASSLSFDEHRAAALLILGLPGMRLLHDGQLTGARLRASIHLRRFPVEPPDPQLAAFYEFLLTTLRKTSVGQGACAILEPLAAWEGNPTAQNIIVIQWQSTAQELDLVAINLAPHNSQCYVNLTIPNLRQKTWQLANLLGSERYSRSGADLENPGLYLDLTPWAAQLFHLS